MNSVSASIVVLSGAVLLAVGGLVQNSDKGAFLMLAGAVVGIVGLSTWYHSLKDR